MNIHVSAVGRPIQWCAPGAPTVNDALLQWPVANGRTMNITTGIIRSTPIAVIVQTAGRRPSTLAAHPRMITNTAITCGRPMCTLPSKNDQVAVGNHSDCTRVPISKP